MNQRVSLLILLMLTWQGINSQELCGPGTIWSQILNACIATQTVQPCGTATVLNQIQGACNPIQSCNSGTVWSQIQRACITAQTCTTGTVWNQFQGTCIPAEQCNAGTIWNQILGICTIIQPTPRNCEYGFRWSVEENRCVTICGSGFNYVNGQCQPICSGDSVWSLKLQKCISIIEGPICPNGYGWNFEQNRCDPFCGDGFIYVNGGCLPKCPPGLVWISKIQKCVSLIDDPKCPKGFGWDSEENKCVSFCGPDYIYVNSSCQPKCPPGYTWSTELRKCIWIAEDIRCPKDYGWDSESKTCLPFCGPGFNFVNGRCQPICNMGYVWSLELQRCVSIIEDVDKCPKGYGWNYEQKRCEPFCGEGFIYVNGGCQPKCSKGFEWSKELGDCIFTNKTCTNGYGWNFEENRCDPFCRSDHILVQGTCQPKCPLNTFWNAELQKCITVDPRCPTGYGWDSETNKCLQFCGKGFIYVNGNCKSICLPNHAWSVDLDKCVYVYDDKDRCPTTGYGWDSVTKKCLPFCGPDYTYFNGDCLPKCPWGVSIWNKELQRCDFLTVNVTHCPTGQGWDSEARTCVPFCGPDFTYVNGSCFPKCRLGYFWSLELQRCARFTCPSGYELVLEQFICKKIQCPQGYKLLDEVCVVDEGSEEKCTENNVDKETDIPISNIINNTNTVYSPTNISNININNIAIHLGSCVGGQSNTTIVRNNETQIVKCPESEEKEPEDKKGKNCCSVIPPRRCIRHGDEWVCFNRRYKVCGEYCTHETMHLKKRRRDCSACFGGGRGCYAECYRDESCQSSSCSIRDYDQFCHHSYHSLCEEHNW